MATLTLSLTSTPVTGSKSYTLSDADVTRWLNALKIVQGSPSATNLQLLSAWADSVVNTAKADVLFIEREVASRAVTGISVT